MIGKLKGTVEAIYSDHVIVDVGSVGYRVYCAGNVLHQTAVGAMVSFYIETHVREDCIRLYGFSNHDEQNAFNILQTVKGVGTKLALAILSEVTPERIQLALVEQNRGLFSNVSGIGPKVAARIITELKDKAIVKGKFDAVVSKLHSELGNNHSIIDEVVAALIGLGISKSDAYNRVNSIIVNNPQLAIDEIIRLALQRRM